jgi:hypothetical protein
LLNPISGIRELFETTSDGVNHSIESFLMRPIPLTSGVLSTASAENATLYDSGPLFTNILFNNKVFSQKVYGFLAFRATTVLRLQVNANKFQQGRLIMDFVPTEYGVSQNRRSGLTRRTQLPHVEFDIGSQTEAVLEIPYINHELAFNTAAIASYKTRGDIGNITLAVYSPLSTGTAGETSLDYTIWVHFKDIELMYPTISDTTIVPQSGNKRSMRVAIGSTTSEVEQNYTGPVSSVSSAVSKAATALSVVPLLSSIAKPVSWFADFVSKTAHSFGFSKPIDDDPVCTVVQKPMAFMNNVNGKDTSVMFAATSNNNIEILPGFAGSDIDALSFDYIKAKPAWIRSVTWTNSNVLYDVLTSIRVSPHLMKTTFQYGTIPSNTVSTYSPAAFLSRFFTYYRGSLGFKFKFVKTSFHSGRLAFVWVPTSSTTVPTINATTFQYLHKEIVDLRDVDEVSFVCPWANTSPYASTDTSYGYLFLVVVNELRMPETCAQSVQLLVESFADSSFELAVPCVPVELPTAQSGKKRDLRQAAIVDTTAGRNFVDEVIQAPGIGSTDMSVQDTVMPARSCIGEKLNSVRQLLKRFTVHAIFATTGSADTVYDMKLYPWTTRLAGVNTTTGVLTVPADGNFDYFTYFSYCYGFYRGGIRLKFAPLNSNVGNTFRIWYDPDNSNSAVDNPVAGYLSSSTDLAPLAFSQFYKDNVNPYTEVSIPYYNRTFSSRFCPDSTSVTISEVGRVRPLGQLYIRHTEKFAATVYRSVAEDFDMGLWLSTPGMTPGLNTSGLSGYGTFTV